MAQSRPEKHEAARRRRKVFNITTNKALSFFFEVKMVGRTKKKKKYM